MSSITKEDLLASIRRAQREIEALGPPPLTLIKVGSLKRFRAEIEKRAGPLKASTPPGDIWPARFNGVPVDETSLLPPNYVTLWRGMEMVGVIDLDKEDGA